MTHSFWRDFLAISNDPFNLTIFRTIFEVFFMLERFSVNFLSFSSFFGGINKYDLLLARKSTDFSSFSLLENQQILACAWLLTMKSTDQHLIWAFLLARNLLISAAFTGKKISWFQLVFLANKSADFSMNLWLENQLISARILDWEISWFQHVFATRKLADFSSTLLLENKLISARILV